MQNLIIDSRIREIEYEYLKQYFNVIKLPLSDEVYEEISGHSDIFYCRIDNKIIAAPNAPINDSLSIAIGQKAVGKTYPDDVLYNACQIGNKVVGSKYTDESIKLDILVKQGYVKCSVCVTCSNSCITTDKGIEKTLSENGIEALFIEEDDIKLLKKDRTVSSMKGFIGGATFVFDGKFVLFGDIDNLSNKAKVLEHLKRHKLELVDFKGLDIYDYGGGLII